jgi:hypothetical protein
VKEQIMNVMVRSITRFLPGKMAEGMKLEEEHMAIARRVLGISARCYRPISVRGDTMRTIICEAEFDSLAAFEAHPEKMGADPEMQKLMPKFEAVIDSVEVEFYTPMPTMYHDVRK